MDEVFFRISLSGNSEVETGDIKQLAITYGAVSLWTLGGLLHSIFDLCLWYLSACACFLPGGCCQSRRNLHSIGSYCVISIVAVLVAVTTGVIVLRATYESRLRQAIQEGAEESDITWKDITSLQSYNFILGYLIELVLVYCVHYPLVASIFFSGILSLGCLPFLGGRPAEVQAELRTIAKASSRTTAFTSA